MTLFELFAVAGAGFGVYGGAVFGSHHGAVWAVVGAVIGAPVGIISGLMLAGIAIVIAHIGCRLEDYFRPSKSKRNGEHRADVNPQDKGK